MIASGKSQSGGSWFGVWQLSFTSHNALPQQLLDNTAARTSIQTVQPEADVLTISHKLQTYLQLKYRLIYN